VAKSTIVLTPEQKSRLAEIQAQAALDAHLDEPPDVKPGSGAFFYGPLLKAVAQLQTARVAAGLTVEQLAERTGLAVDDLARLEAGRLPNPTWGLLGRYAVAVGRSLGLTVGPLPERPAARGERQPAARPPDPQPQP
jgi:DNA-binding XRE family transcriptional regulator